MEHRFNAREEVNSPVLVFHELVGCIKALVKNVSTNGMLVDTGRSTLPKGVVVELAGPASWKLESKTGLPKALVVHSENGKAGLMLEANSTRIARLPGIGTTLSLKKDNVQ